MRSARQKAQSGQAWSTTSLLAIPGAYAWIGNGPSAGLHNPAFDYNDEILPVAANYLAATAKAALGC